MYVPNFMYVLALFDVQKILIYLVNNNNQYIINASRYKIHWFKSRLSSLRADK